MAILSIAEQNAHLKAFYLKRINPRQTATITQMQTATDPAAILHWQNDRSAKIRRALAQSLAKWAEQRNVAQCLTLLLSDSDYQVRWFAALSLSFRPPVQNQEILTGLLTSNKTENWLLASVIQRRFVLPELKPLLIQGLKSEQEAIRNLAVVMLGRMGELQLISQLNTDPSPAVRDAVADFFTSPNPNLTVAATPDLNTYRACLLATASGDALGAPVEFSSLQDIRAIGYVRDYLQDPGRPLKPGDYTDDTLMALMVARAAILSGGVDPREVTRLFAAYALSLDLGETHNIGFSSSTLTSYRKLYAGLNWRLVAQPSNGCGPATAVIPLGLITNDLEQLRRDVTSITLITKTGREALAGALAVSFLVFLGRWRQMPESPEVVANQTAAFVEDVSPALAFEIRRLVQPAFFSLPIEEGLNRIPHTADGKKIKIGMKAIGVVPSAIFCFLKSPTDLPTTVLTAVNTQGDSDSIAAIAGAISGTHNGLAALPTGWLAGLTARDEIDSIAHQLAALQV